MSTTGLASAVGGAEGFDCPAPGRVAATANNEREDIKNSTEVNRDEENKDEENKDEENKDEDKYAPPDIKDRSQLAGKKLLA
jgi:hypothetical protein